MFPGPYVARINPISGQQVWRTYLENGNVDNVFMGGTNLNILPNGNIVFAWNYKIALLDPSTGAILKERDLPSPGSVTPRSINYKELTIAPDGTIILRSQNRPENCNQQGGGGLEGCSQSTGGPEQKPSPMLAINPSTLQIYDQLVMPEDSATPTIIVPYRGKIAIYSACSSTPTASSGIPKPRSSAWTRRGSRATWRRARPSGTRPPSWATGSSSRRTGSAAIPRPRRLSRST